MSHLCLFAVASLLVVSVVCAAQDGAAAAVAVSGDKSLVIVRGTHVELGDGGETTVVVSRFVAVDVDSGQLVGSVGEACRGLAPATAEFVGNTRSLVVTCNVTAASQQAADAADAACDGDGDGDGGDGDDAGDGGDDGDYCCCC